MIKTQTTGSVKWDFNFTQPLIPSIFWPDVPTETNLATHTSNVLN